MEYFFTKSDTPKFISKWLKLAQTIAEDNGACYSRKIGSVLVDPRTNTVVSIGYNGTPKGSPDTDSYDYLRNYFWPQLTQQEKENLVLQYKDKDPLINSFTTDEIIYIDEDMVENVCRYFEGCKTCPRRLVGAESGERAELCSCVSGHSETTCLLQSPVNPYGFYLYCYCGVPCQRCTGMIINAGLAKVYCLKVEEDYSPVSRWLFKRSNVELIEVKEKDI